MLIDDARVDLGLSPDSRLIKRGRSGKEREKTDDLPSLLAPKKSCHAAFVLLMIASAAYRLSPLLLPPSPLLNPSSSHIAHRPYIVVVVVVSPLARPLDLHSFCYLATISPPLTGTLEYYSPRSFPHSKDDRLSSRASYSIAGPEYR